MGAPAETLPAGRWPKSHRIRTRLQYQAVQSGGMRVVSPRFVFLVNAQEVRLDHSRMGVTASRKVGGAVVRNRAKRLVREAFRATQDIWPPGIDVVVVVRNLDPETHLPDVIQEWRSNAGRLARPIQALLGGANRKRHAAPDPAGV